MLAKNGRMSASSRLKHVHTRFYLIKDHQDCGEVEVKYEPTGKMWTDILAKPKQGKAFRKMRGMMMNIAEDYDDGMERRNTHPGLLPKIENENPTGSHDKATLIKAVNQDRTMTHRTLKPTSHRRSVLGESVSSGIQTPPLSNKRTENRGNKLWW